MAHRALIGLSKKLQRNVISNLSKPSSGVQSFKNLLVLDFEATCIANGILKPQEIIEFPCLALSTDDWQVKDVFHEYVKPKVHPHLYSFCTELTGIMQETVENEEYFPQVFTKFCQWLKDGNYFDEENKSAFVTSGDWDLRILLQDQCKLDDIKVPHYFDQWINLKTIFFLSTNHYPRSLNDMLNRMKMEFQGKYHCGIDDTHNIVRVIQALHKKHKANFDITSNINENKIDL